jgi:hypothetical protein
MTEATPTKKLIGLPLGSVHPSTRRHPPWMPSSTCRKSHDEGATDRPLHPAVSLVGLSGLCNKLRR